MRLLLIDDDQLSCEIFANLVRSEKILRGDSVIETRTTPLDGISDYWDWDCVIFDHRLGLTDLNGQELTGLEICKRVHAYQYQRGADGKRLHARRPTSLMLLTSSRPEELAFNTREFVDQVAYKYGAGIERTVDDPISCLRALMRARAC